jgi:hypothetical protein
LHNARTTDGEGAKIVDEKPVADFVPVFTRKSDDLKANTAARAVGSLPSETTANEGTDSSLAG